MRLTRWTQALLDPLCSARYRVDGDSMAPTLRHGESVLVARPCCPLSSSGDRLRRGDVVVVQPGHPEFGVSVKRIVGLPGEDVRVDGGRVYITAEGLGEELLAEAYASGEGGRSGEWFNGPEEFFVLGDNRAASGDSRFFGPVARGAIVGRVWFRCWPPAAWGFVRRG